MNVMKLDVDGIAKLVSCDADAERMKAALERHLVVGQWVLLTTLGAVLAVLVFPRWILPAFLWSLGYPIAVFAGLAPILCVVFPKQWDAIVLEGCRVRALLTPLRGGSKCEEALRLVEGSEAARGIRNAAIQAGRQLYGFDLALMEKAKEAEMSRQAAMRRDEVCAQLHAIVPEGE